MEIILKNGTLPIYEQVYQQIKKQIMNSSLKENTELPSIRGLAKELNISVITIKKAYELLVTDGLAYSIPGKGHYVSTIDLAFRQTEITKYLCNELDKLEKIADSYDLSLQTIFKRRNKNDNECD
ncbi:GntR family transcriptional regulator [Vagococcus sp.]|uniref:GntR family transcriptional regulator n=1 Tax=Vagococcus sp. TaxID=1933889 RepID=UPI003F9C3F86